MMRRKWKRQEELNAYVIRELVELRGLIQQANSDHARERDELEAELVARKRELAEKTGLVT